MAHIQKFPFLRHLRADASSYVQQFKKGRRVRSGKGLAFWFLPSGVSLSEMPMDDRMLPYLLKGQSADYQNLTVQGSIVWRVSDPEILGDRIDFSVDLTNGALLGQPVDQINDQIGSLGRRFIVAHVKSNSVRDILQAGVEPLQSALKQGFDGDTTLSAMGIEIVGVGVDDVSPSSELARALQAPTFESLQQQADEASFARRAMAVEKERAIAENELSTKVELEAQRNQLIARQDENARANAKAHAAALKIEADAESGRIRIIDQAKVDMEKERIAVYADLPPMVMFGMAAQEFAGKLQHIDNLTVTPDMLSNMIGQVQAAIKSGAVTNKARP
ncbi:MAG: hypothetical protein L3J33_00080 [Rhodobacteraceae bacterium]|nr:hypothetical protein [Paracoccaceae bacterium]